MTNGFHDNSDITHHFADRVLGFVELLPGSIDQALGLSDSMAGTVGPGARVVNCSADVLQAVPLSGQSVVYVAQAVQQTTVDICRVKGDGEEKVSVELVPFQILMWTSCYLCWSEPHPAAPLWLSPPP